MKLLHLAASLPGYARRTGGSQVGARARKLVVKESWLENHPTFDEAFLLALTHGFQRFMQFVGAPDLVCKSVLERIRT